MLKTDRSTRTIDVADAHRVLDRASESAKPIDARVVISSEGIPVAGFVSAEDVERLDRLDRDAEFDRVLTAMRAPFVGVPIEEIEREAAKALAEVDAERAARRSRGEAV